MNAKQYLKQAYRLNEMINSDIVELEQLKELSKTISSPSMSGMPGSGTRNNEAPFVKTIEKIIDLENYINAEIDRFVDLKKQIRDVINTAQSYEERLVLKYRYTEFLKWDAVAYKMNLSLKQIHRIHNDALKNIKLPFDTE